MSRLEAGSCTRYEDSTQRGVAVSITSQAYPQHTHVLAFSLAAVTISLRAIES